MKKSQAEWNLTWLCKNDAEASKAEEFTEIRTKYTEFANKWKKNEKYLTDVDVLVQALDELEELTAKYDCIGRTGYYWILRHTQEKSDSLVKEMYTKTLSLDAEISNLIQFFELNLGKIPKEQQKLFLKAKKLDKYRHYLEQLFETAKYMLSDAEEKILHLKAQSSHDKWVELRSELIANSRRRVLTKRDKIETKTFEEILSLTSNKDQKIREIAAMKVNDVLKRHVIVAEHELNAILLDKKIDDDLRGFDRPDMARLVGDDIAPEIVDTLRDVVTKNFDIPQKYYRLKAALLKKKKLHYYERGVEFGNLKGSYSYDEAVKIVQKTFDDLDHGFGAHFKKMLVEGLIDPLPKVGKSGGAACFSAQKTMPSYVYLNFAGKLRDLSTIAHEAGHAIHHEMSKKQHALYSGSTKATAEVASTFMEDFVINKVAVSLDEKSKLTLLMAQLDDQMASLFRQIALYNFEFELHQTFKEKTFMSQKEIGTLFLKHMSAYMGDAVEMSKGSENWWVYWSHIRMFFYVYSYASGLLISKSLQREVKKDKKFVEKVKEFLSAGESLSAKDIFGNIGVNITGRKFWEEGVQEIRETVETAEKLAKKLKLIK